MSNPTLYNLWVSHRLANRQIALHTKKVVEQNIRMIARWIKNLNSLDALLSVRSIQPHMGVLLDTLQLADYATSKVVATASLESARASLPFCEKTIDQMYGFAPEEGGISLYTLHSEAQITKELVWAQIQMLTILCNHIQQRRYTLVCTRTVLEQLIKNEQEYPATSGARTMMYRRYLNNTNEHILRLTHVLDEHQRCVIKLRAPELQ